MATPELTSDLMPELMPRFLWRKLRRDWLVFDREVSATEVTDDWFNLVFQRRCQLERATISISNRATNPISKKEHLRPRVLIAETDPTQFLAGFWAALLAGWDIALANPRWGAQEWTTTHHLIQPHLVWAASIAPQIAQINENYLSGSDAPSCFDKLDYKNLDRKKSDQRLILIPTGGSSGQVKFVCHCWESLVTSAVGFCDYFGANKTINAYCVLPLYHVSGLMQAMRTLVSGGQLFLANFKDANFKNLCQSPASSIPQLPRSSSTFISLVPTQLERLLQAGKAEWLCQFEGVLLGGAPPWAELLRKAAAVNIPVCLSYGMTETAAMVSAIDSEAFLQANGQIASSGRPLPHTDIRIERDGQCLLPGEVGQVVVRSQAIAKGYYDSTPSSAFASNTFYTDDLGYLDASGELHISGRISHKIISGGENIFPAEVEVALRNTQQVSDVYVLGLPDSEWGEVVTAVYVPSDRSVSPASLKSALSSGPASTHTSVNNTSVNNGVPLLSHYKHPKRWIALDKLPRNAQGKLNRSALLRQALSQEASQ